MGSFSKRQIEEWAKLDRAIELGAIVDAFERCPNHGDVYIDTLKFMIPDELADAILEEEPEAIEEFDSRDDMVKALKNALEHVGESCPSCDKD